MMTVTTDERLGFPSASGMDRIMQCAGSWVCEEVASQQAVPVPDGNRDAAHGTKIHKASELGDVSDLDDEDAQLVTTARLIEERLVTEWLSETDSQIEEVTIYRELRLWCDGYFSGQLDTLVVNPKNKTGYCLDLKSGRKKVAPTVRNFQLRAQAVLAFLNFDLESVRTAIVQPMAFGKKHSACEYSKAHLQVALSQLKTRIEYVRAPGLPRTAGPACEFCRARHVCPEAKRSMVHVIGAQSLNWNIVTPSEKLKLWKAADMAEDCAKLIKDQIKADLTADPESIPGLVKARDQKPRSIKDLPGVVKASAPEGLSLDPIAENDFLWDWIAMAKVSVGDLEKFLMSRHGWTKKAAKDWIAAHPDLIVESTRSGKIEVDEEFTPISPSIERTGEPATPHLIESKESPISEVVH